MSEERYIPPKYRRRNRNWFQRMLWKIRHPWWYMVAISIDTIKEKRLFDEMREESAKRYWERMNSDPKEMAKRELEDMILEARRRREGSHHGNGFLGY